MSERSLQYVNRLLALPSMKEWYASALDEVWRYDEYEKALHQVGTLLADHRRAAG